MVRTAPVSLPDHKELDLIHLVGQFHHIALLHFLLDGAQGILRQQTDAQIAALAEEEAREI